MAERTILNFIGRLSGVATLTKRYVDAVDGMGVIIASTRKTTPGLRALEKRAVRLGGGGAHRYGLDDAMLIKDNHIAAAGGVAKAMERARAAAAHLTAIEIEVDTLDQLKQALPHAPSAILLDNFSLTDLRTAVKLAKGQTLLEASGGITIENVFSVAETGVDVISIGALTHSARALDIGLDVVD
jgi:nicotinate-nucleotide pyrophosphorylase (carboxylating)